MDAAGERRRRRQPGGGVRPARERRVGRGRALSRTRRSRSTLPRLGARRLAYAGPFDDARAGRGVEHRVIPWDEVSLDEGTGIVHIAPGCGGEDFELAQRARPAGADAGRRGGPLLRRLRLAARPLDDRGGGPDRRQPRRDAACSSRRACTSTATRTAGAATRRSSSASPTTGSSPSTDLRQPMLDANATVEWTPEYMGKRMDDWLRNMGDWNISRRRYYGLPLPFYPCACGHLNVIGSRAELEERALGGLEQLEELRRPWIDRVPIRCEECGEPVERVKEVGDVWLDAGIVPFSTLGWQNAEWVERGLRDGRGARADDAPTCRITRTGRSGSRPTGSRRCASRSGSGSTRSSSCRSCSPGGRRSGGCSATRRCSTRRAARCTARGGTRSSAEDAFARMGADVMRWQYCAQPPDREPPLRLRAGGGDQARAPDVLELGLVLRRLREHRRVPAVVGGARAGGRPASRSTAGSSSGRTRSSPTRRAAYERCLDAST